MATTNAALLSPGPSRIGACTPTALNPVLRHQHHVQHLREGRERGEEGVPDGLHQEARYVQPHEIGVNLRPCHPLTSNTAFPRLSFSPSALGLFLRQGSVP